LTIFLGCILKNILISALITQHFNDGLQNNLPGAGPTLESGTFLRDLASLNIQRGRDHGLPSYVNYAELCGSEAITDYSSLFLFNFAALIQLMESYE
jgi:hypothetical protein